MGYRLLLAALVVWMPTIAVGQSAAPDLTSRSRASFRPSPLRGESMVPGRNLDLRQAMAAKRVFSLSAEPLSPAAVQSRRTRAAESRARLRASQQSRSRMASLTSRQARSTGRPSPVSHVLTIGFGEFTPTEEFVQTRSADQTRWVRNVSDRLGIADMAIERTGTSAILRGRATSEEDARIAERMVHLEPGVVDVVNEIEIVEEPLPAEPADR